jgi:hypothetical protein
MKKWAIPAVIYLIAVIGVYILYTQVAVNGNDDKKEHQVNHVQEQSNSGHGHGEQHGEKSSGEHESQIKPEVEYVNDSIVVNLKDQQGNLFDDLEVNHEKLLHLIIVDEHLDHFYHVHPEKVSNGTFKLNKDLPEGTYKAFVDIKTKNLAYQVEPIIFTIGELESDHSHHSLQPDQALTKKVDGYEVTLKMNQQKVNEPITLSFELDQTDLQPYLGAMGHIVILNEEATNYIHVHPANKNEPIFETQFDQPGIYKIWAEFKQNGIVRAFPFVVEIK